MSALSFLEFGKSPVYVLMYQKVDIAVLLLRDHADVWYARATKDGSTFPNLTVLENAMLSDFFPAYE